MHWIYISLLLCIFGFLTEICPSKSLLPEYLYDRDVTHEEVMSVLSIFLTKKSNVINYFLFVFSAGAICDAVFKLLKSCSHGCSNVHDGFDTVLIFFFFFSIKNILFNRNCIGIYIFILM